MYDDMDLDRLFREKAKEAEAASRHVGHIGRSRDEKARAKAKAARKARRKTRRA